MNVRIPLAALVAAALAAPALAPAQNRGAPQQVAQGSYEILNSISARTDRSLDNNMRRCRGAIDEAESAERLGSRDMALKYWEAAARVCRVDAVLACRNMRSVAPLEQCEYVQGLSIN